MNATKSAAKKSPSKRISSRRISEEAALRVRAVLIKRDDPKSQMRYYLLEEPPRYHLLHRDPGTASRYVPHPWTYYGIADYTFSRTEMLTRVHALFCRASRLTDKNRAMYYSPFPNLSYCWRPCYGPVPQSGEKATFDRISHTLNHWWDAVSNNDYMIDQWSTNGKVVQHLGMKSALGNGLLKNWSKMTLADLRGIPWKQIGLEDPWRAVLKGPLVDRAFTSDRSLLPKKVL